MVSAPDLSPEEARKVAAFGLDKNECTPSADHISPDCGEGKHKACRGADSAWCTPLDTVVACLCSCHFKALEAS